MSEAIGDTERRAACAYCRFKGSVRTRTGNLPWEFLRKHPAEARTLAAHHDAMHPGFNNLLARKTRDAATKVDVAFNVARQQMGCENRRLTWFRRHSLGASVSLAVLLLPLTLSPTHPVAVYGYLAAVYVGPMFGMETASSTTTRELEQYLTSPERVGRYRQDLHDDVMDTNTGKFFLIVRNQEGELEQESIRTWNGFLPSGLPASLSRWLDRMEVPFLGDEVKPWLRGKKLVAIGHYHAYGGPPSRSDEKVRRITRVPEVVIANGLVPMIYVNGKLVPFGRDVRVTPEVFTGVRVLEEGLVMDPLNKYRPLPEMPSVYLLSFLGFLRDCRGVDITSLPAIQLEVDRIYDEFVASYAGTGGMSIREWCASDNYDVRAFFHKVWTFHGWALSADLCERLRGIMKYSAVLK